MIHVQCISNIPRCSDRPDSAEEEALAQTDRRLEEQTDRLERRELELVQTDLAQAEEHTGSVGREAEVQTAAEAHHS